MNALDTRKAVQALLGVVQDGNIGPKTDAAYQALKSVDSSSPWPPAVQPSGELHTGIATSFADPADVVAFRKCKAAGGSDEHCFSVGDNGIGKWGDDCSQGSGPACALPPEDWEPFGAAAHLKKVIVNGNGRSVMCFLKDTMPHKANIKNGAIIDLSPDSVTALGWNPPLKQTVTWQWA